MLRALLRGQIRKLERTWNYDASYAGDLVDLSPWVFIKFGLAATLGHRRWWSFPAMAAVGLVGTLAEDCGPCTQICVDMALAHGVDPAVLRAVLAGDLDAMGEDAALAYAFARASLARDLEAADPLRERILARWGKSGLTALALALTTARMYPTLKYALGHGRACSRIVVGGVGVVAHRPEELAA
jgi:hypothetical protein